MKMRPLFLTLMATGCLGLIISFWPDQSQSPAEQQAETPRINTTVSAEAPEAAAQSSLSRSSGVTTGDTSSASGSWDAAAYSQVLAGTEIDGRLLTDSAGNLVISIEVMDFFNYFLSAVGDVTPERAMEEIQRQAALRLPPSALEQLTDLLTDYVSYQQLMVEYMQQPLIPEDQQNYAYYAQTMRDTFGQIRELRRQVFAPEVVEAFFSLDETYGEYAVATMEIHADNSLSEPEKAERIEQIKQLLPEQMRAAEDEARQRTAAVQAAREQFAQGAGISALKDTLGALYNDEEIAGMAAAFREERAWQQRVDHYLKEREQVLTSTLSESDKAAQVEQLRQQHFDGLDLVRAQTEEVIFEQRRGAS